MVMPTKQSTVVKAHEKRNGFHPDETDDGGAFAEPANKRPRGGEGQQRSLRTFGERISQQHSAEVGALWTWSCCGVLIQYHCTRLRKVLSPERKMMCREKSFLLTRGMAYDAAACYV